MAALTWDGRNVLTAVSCVLVAGLCGFPLLYLMVEGVGSADVGLWVSSGALLARSLGLGAAAALLATILGGVAALALHECPRRWKGVLLVVLVIPVLLPSYIHALTWSNLLSGSHWLRRSLAPRSSPTGWAVSVWVLAVSYYPIALLLILAALRRWDERFTWSAWANGRGPNGVGELRRRYLRAPVLTGVFVIFLLAFADFAVPDYFQLPTYATEIFVQISGYLDTSRAMALVLPVLAVSALLFWALARASGRLTLTSSYGTSVMVPSAKVDPGPSWRACGTGLLLAGVLVAVPLGNLLHMAREPRVIGIALEMVWPDAVAGYALALPTAALAVVIGLFSAYAAQRSSLRAAQWIRVVPAALFAVPASLLGLLTIRVWNQSSALGWAYDCGLALLLALLARWLPVSLEILLSGWRQVGRPQEEAAHANGIPWARALYRVLLPQLRPALSLAFLLTTIFAFNELTLVTLLAPPGMSTLPLRVFQTVHYGPESLLAAICLWHLAFLLVPAAALLAVSRRWLGRWMDQQDVATQRAFEISR
jgi:iron(III) transport system permease protein